MGFPYIELTLCVGSSFHIQNRLLAVSEVVIFMRKGSLMNNLQFYTRLFEFCLHLFHRSIISYLVIFPN